MNPRAGMCLERPNNVPIGKPMIILNVNEERVMRNVSRVISIKSLSKLSINDIDSVREFGILLNYVMSNDQYVCLLNNSHLIQLIILLFCDRNYLTNV